MVHLFLEVVRQFRHQKDCLHLEKIQKRLIWKKIRTLIKAKGGPLRSVFGQSVDKGKRKATTAVASPQAKKKSMTER